MTNVDVRDFKAVAIALAEQVVQLQALVNALKREKGEVEAEHAKCPKPEKEKVDAQARTEG